MISDYGGHWLWLVAAMLEAKKYGTKYLISKDDIKWFVFQQELEREN